MWVAAFFSFDTLTLYDSTVSSNEVTGTAALGGGGGIFSLSSVTIIRSTVSGNRGTGPNASGAGILAYSAFVYAGVTLTSSTVTDNHAEHTTATGGGIWSKLLPITIANSIVAGNTAGGGSPDIRPGTGALDVDFSLIGDNDGTSLVESQTPNVDGNLIGSSSGGGIIDPLLGLLSENGGPTRTHALLPGSPALDAGNSIQTTDQRGSSVPVDLPGIANAAGGNGSDLGAYEAQSAPSADFVDNKHHRRLRFHSLADRLWHDQRCNPRRWRQRQRRRCRRQRFRSLGSDVWGSGYDAASGWGAVGCWL